MVDCDPAAVARAFDVMLFQIARLKKELELYRKWAAAIDKWHTELCRRLGVEPIHPCTRSGRPLRAAKRKDGGL